MMIVLLSVQFYKDVIPVFTEGEQLYEKRFHHSYKEDQHAGVFRRKD